MPQVGNVPVTHQAIVATRHETKCQPLHFPLTYFPSAVRSLPADECQRTDQEGL